MEDKADNPKELMNPLRQQAIEKYIRLMAKTYEVENICVALSIGGDEYCWSTRRYPSVSEHTKYETGCIGKALSAASILEMHKNGILNIDHPVGAYLQEFVGTTIGEKVLVRHLMCTTAGYMGFQNLNKDVWSSSWEDLVSSLRDAPQLFTPGEVYSRDHSAYVLLAVIVSRVCGRSWMEVVDEMIGTAIFGRRLYEGRDVKMIWSAAVPNVLLSPNELVLLGEVLMKGGSHKTGRILSVDTAMALSRTLVRSAQLSGVLCSHWFPFGHGLGLAEYHSNVRGSCGKSFTQLSSVRCLKQLDMTLAVCIDSTKSHVRYAVLDALLAEMGISKPENAARVPFPLAPDEVPGSYIGARGVEMDVELDGLRICFLIRSRGRPPARLLGTIHEDCTFSIDRSAIAGIAFFRNPSDGCPSMLFGTLALRKSSRTRSGS